MNQWHKCWTVGPRSWAVVRKHGLIVPDTGHSFP